MKTIRESELYENLTGFLKSKGIVLTEGGYSRSVQRGCALLTDAINLGQRSLRRASAEVNRKVAQLRQTLHEKTATRTKGKPGSAMGSATAGQPKAGAKTSAKAAPKRAKQKPRGSRRPSRKKG